MSKVSDDLKLIIAKTMEGEKDGPPRVIKSLFGGGNEYPGVPAYQEWSREQCGMVLRAGKMHFAGAAPFENGTYAIAKTSDKIQRDVMSLLIRSLSAGYMVGLHPALWQMETVEFKKMFRDTDWQTNSMLQAVHFANDHDVLDVVANHYADSVSHCVKIFRIPEAPPEHHAKVWDMWFAAINASTMAFYVNGIALGRKNAEDEILSRIATESESEDK